MTRDHFMKLTDQQKWDAYLLLESECGGAYLDEATHKFTDEELDAIKQQPSTGD